MKTERSNGAYRFDSREVLGIFLVSAAFTAAGVVYSLRYGRLSVPPAYDDIIYLKDGLLLIDWVYQHGWGRLPFYVFGKTWHAPLHALQACVGFAMFGKLLWAPYLFNGCYLAALLYCVRKEARLVPGLVFWALVVSILAWPLTSFLILEFRPDIPASLFLALGTWRLSQRHVEIRKGEYRTIRSLWPMTWPFLLALWLKPSLSPVIVGLWLAGWILLCCVSWLVDNSREAFRYSAEAFSKTALSLGVLFAPYLAVSASHLISYFNASVFSEGRKLWSPPLPLLENLNYYLAGGAGRVTMGPWLGAAGVIGSLAFLSAFRTRDYRGCKIGGIFFALGIVSWAGMTMLGNKSAWFGAVVTSHILGIFLVSTVYFANRYAHQRIAQYSAAVLIVCVSLMLQAPTRSDGAIPELNKEDIHAYSHAARRMYSETCKAIQANSNGKDVLVLMPLISTIINPDSIELCGMESGGRTVRADMVQSSQFEDLQRQVQSAARAGSGTEFAVVLSEDFPGIPSYLPLSRRAGSINSLFTSSRDYYLVADISDSDKTRHVRIFRKRPVFSPIENSTGVRGVEGPYPEKLLPRVRWMLFPSAEFDLASNVGHSSKLVLTGLAVQRSVVAEIRLSTGGATRCEFDSTRFTDCNVDFVANGSSTHVKIAFSFPGVDAALSHFGGEAVLFSRLAVIDNEIGSNIQSANWSGPFLPPFAHIDLLEGFGSVDGPFPASGELPVVLGFGDASKIGFARPGSPGSAVELEWRPGIGVKAFDVVVGQKVCGHCEYTLSAGQYQRCRITLPGPDTTEIELRYVGDQSALASKMNNSAVFRRIARIGSNS